jgi:hypothetical protein
MKREIFFLKCFSDKEPRKKENIQIFIAGNKRYLRVHNRSNEVYSLSGAQCFTKSLVCDMRKKLSF